MIEDLAALPIAEADRLAREKIDHHRNEMGRWRQARAARVVQEREAGRRVPEIAADLGVTTQVVYTLLREVQPDTDTSS